MKVRVKARVRLRVKARRETVLFVSVKEKNECAGVHWVYDIRIYSFFTSNENIFIFYIQ